MDRKKLSRPFKILLIGDSAVGKTSLMFRFADNQFSETFIPTIGIDFKTKAIHVRDRKVQLQLWDTAGQEKFFNIVRSYYRNADAVILVYDRTSASTFQNVSRWMKNVDESAPEDVIRILVGNKSDLYDRLVVSNLEGQRLATKYNVTFFETSAKLENNSNVANIFYFLAEKLLDREQPISPSSAIHLDVKNSKDDSVYSKVASCCSSGSLK